MFQDTFLCNVEFKATKESSQTLTSFSSQGKAVNLGTVWSKAFIFREIFHNFDFFSPVLKQVFISCCQSVELYSLTVFILNKIYNLLGNKEFKL